MDVPILANLNSGSGRCNEHVAGLQLVNAIDDAFRSRRTHCAEQVVDRCPIQTGLDFRKLKQNLQLRTERQPSCGQRVEQRLDADTVARQKQFLFAVVPDGEGEHASHFLDACFTILFIEMNDHLGIGACIEPVPLPLE